MGEVLPLPNRGEAFDDLRGEGRTLRVSWHSDERTLVLSMWHLGQCRATFRLPSDQVPDLVRSLVVAGLTDVHGPAKGTVAASVLPMTPPATADDPDEAAAPTAAAPTGAAPALFLAPTESGTRAAPGAAEEQPGQG